MSCEPLSHRRRHEHVSKIRQSSTAATQQHPDSGSVVSFIDGQGSRWGRAGTKDIWPSLGWNRTGGESGCWLLAGPRIVKNFITRNKNPRARVPGEADGRPRNQVSPLEVFHKFPFSNNLGSIADSAQSYGYSGWSRHFYATSAQIVGNVFERDTLRTSLQWGTSASTLTACTPRTLGHQYIQGNFFQLERPPGDNFFS